MSRAPRWGLRILPPLVGSASVVAVFAFIELLLHLDVLNRFIIPFPSDVVLSLWRVIVEEDVPGRFLLTAGEALGAGALVAVFGVGAGILLYQVTVLRIACETWVAALAAAPIVLAYPLFLVIFGRSALTIIMMGFAAGFAPVVLKTLEGLSSVRPVLLNVARSYKLTRRQQFLKVLLPAAIPTIFVGLRLGLIFALINVVGVEFLINFGGLGQLINDLAERYDLAGTYAAIAFVVVVSVLFFVLLERIERWLQPATGR